MSLAQLTVTVGLNDIFKSNQADYIMHQNMEKWYSSAATSKEHLTFLGRNKVELLNYKWKKVPKSEIFFIVCGFESSSFQAKALRNQMLNLVTLPLASGKDCNIT